MRLYPQFIIWTYIVLPAICIFLAPAFISLFVKAQQQKVKILSNIINAKARTASALAKNHAKMHHLRPTRFSNIIDKKGGLKMRSKRDVEEMVPLKGTHWDQQEESMGQLQNMWNMNMNNMMNDGILREAEPEADPHKKNKRPKHHKHGKKFRSSQQEFETLGSPRVYDDRKKYEDGPESFTGSFFGRNVYDDFLTQVNEPMENEFARSHHKKKYKKYNKKGHDYPYYSGNYYRDADAPMIMENAPREDIIFREPNNLMSVHVEPMPDFQFEPHDDHMDMMLREQAPNPNMMEFNLELPQDHQPAAFRRNNENEEMAMQNMPQEFMLMEPNLMQQETRSSSDGEEFRKNPDILRSLPDIYDTGYGGIYGSGSGSSYGNYDSSYGKPKGKKLNKYGGYDNDYDYGNQKNKFDPFKLYEKTLEELADINKRVNKQIEENTKNLLHPEKLYKTPKIYPQIPVANYADDYNKYDDGNINGGYIDIPSNGGYIGGADLYKEAKKANPDPSFSHTISHSHSFTHNTDTDLFKKHQLKKLPLKPIHHLNKAEAHSKSLHFKHGGFSQADSKSISHGTTPNLFEETQGYGHTISQAAAAQAAAQANTLRNYNGGFSQAAAQANSANQFNNRGFGKAQAAAQANSGSQFNNGGFGQAQAAAQANSGNQFNNGGFSQAQAAAQANTGNQFNNGGFSQVQADAQASSGNHINGGFSQAQSAAQAQGTSGQANAQANSNGNWNNGASAQAASQSFSNAAFGQPHVAAPANSGPQFFQVLAPSNFVNARSNDDNQRKPNSGFVMPHLQEIPVADTLHGMLDKNDRVTRSHGLNLASSIVDSSLALNQPEGQKTSSFVEDIEDSSETFDHKKHSRDNIFEGLNLASGIVHASLDNPLVHQHKRANNDRKTVQEAMNLASGIVDSSLKVGSHGQPDSLESPKGMFSPISDIVHRSIRHKRQIFEGNNNYPCPVMIENRNDAIVGQGPETNFPKQDPINCPDMTENRNGAVVRAAPEQNIPQQDTTITEPPRAVISKMHPDQQKNQANNDKWNNESTNFDDEMIEMINPEDPEFTSVNTPPMEADKKASKELDREKDSLLVDDLKIIVHPKNDEGFYEELESQKKVEHVIEDSISSTTEGLKDKSGNTEQTIDKVSALIEPNKDLSTLTSEEIEDVQFRLPDVTETVQNHQQDTELLGSPHKISESDPLASIEKEMSVLTEEEQEAFIKQEMALIADFIEETLHKEPLPHIKEPANKKTEDHDKVPDEKHHEIPTIKEPEAVTQNPLSHQSTTTEKNQQSHLVPSPNDPVENSKNSESTQEPQERLSSPHLLQAPERDTDHIPYDRHARAPFPFDQSFDEIVGAQREKLHEIHKGANQDANLMLISFIGEGIIKDLENSRRQIEEKARSSNRNRHKRKIDYLNPNYYPIQQLVTDPRTKIDVPKTLENVGTVVRYTFEDPRAPMYHLRNALGNTKNTVMAAVKVPPNNILLPTQYEVASLSEDVGAINPIMVNSRSGFDNIQEDPFGIANTFQQLGGIVQGSVNSGKDVVRHATDVASDMKQVYYTSKNSGPLTMLPSQIPVITSRFAGPTPAIFLAPRVVDLVSTAQEPPPRQFVGMGNILDAVGVSKPAYKMERTKWKPIERKRQHFLDPEEEEMRKPNLKHFFNKMHQEMKEILTAQHEERKRKLKDPAVSLNNKKEYEFAKKKSTTSPPSINYDKVIDEHQHVTLPPEILGIFSQNNPVSNQNGLHLQPELMKPFMGQASEDEFSEFMRENGDEEALDGINKDELRRQSQPVEIKSRFQYSNENDQVGLNLQPELMKPFMGQASKDEFSEFMRENGDELPLERNNEKEFRRQVLNQNPVKIESRFQQFDKNSENVQPPDRKVSSYPFPLNFNIALPADGQLKPIILKDFLPSEGDIMVGQKNLQYTSNMDETNYTDGRSSMTINDQYQKPFLGLIKHDKVHKFLNKYGNSLPENGEHYDDYPEEIYHPVKNVVYSDDNDDYFIW
ncbi:unnamed protein product [Ceutorhynchus assimilis]|uniref:Uncharacterized protein n=1 Tax=Ceutorhynchus assimilis TaxID=467358 RepID=A0A9N9QEV2_9CUCU|nr:unnamed protein product [Ceutorhynchus assimilis]